MTHKPIGGYFGLEKSNQKSFFGDIVFKVNSGRHALELILRGIDDIGCLYVPLYTCDAVLDCVKKLNLKWKFYSITETLEANLEDVDLSPSNNYIICTNYFGVKDGYVDKLCQQYKQHVIVDQAQALFSNNKNAVYQFYSPRKFVGLADGGFCRVSDRIEEIEKIYGDLQIDESWDKCWHLLKRIDVSSMFGYTDYKKVSEIIAQADLQKQSQLTSFMLDNIDFEHVKTVRFQNFNYLHARLKQVNQFVLDEDDISAPLCYPLWTKNGELLKKELIANHVFVASYWPNILDWCPTGSREQEFYSNIVALPLDQRYTKEDMERVYRILKNYI